MKLIELALDPRKASRRFSPFSDELSEGMERKLEYLFGDFASVDPSDRAIYSREVVTPPPVTGKLLKRKAWAVVRPRVRGDLIELIKFANNNFVPLVPRGGGTSLYGSSTPTEGGIVVDMREFSKILDVNAGGKTVRVEAGISFWDLEQALRAQGLALRQYPVLAHASTVAGAIAAGGGGFGSLKYGPFANDVLEVTVVRPDGELVKLKGEDLALVTDAHGTTGFIVEATLKVRDATEETPYLASFDDRDAMAKAARRIAREADAWHLMVYSPEYANLFNDAVGPRSLPAERYTILAATEGDQGADKIRGIVEDEGGKLEKEDAAAAAWARRFDVFAVKKLGPSLVLGEAIVDVDRVGDALRASERAGMATRQGHWGLAVSPNDFNLVYVALEDERRAAFTPAVGNAMAHLQAVKRAGGRAANTGVFQARESKRILGAERYKRLRAYKKETDPREIFNPGPVFGARSRLNPLPTKDLNVQLAVGERFLAPQRGMAAGYEGGAKMDPSQIAAAAAVGRVLGGELASLAYEIFSHAFTGKENFGSPARTTANWESELPRGRVAAARALLEGEAHPTNATHRKIARAALEHNPDALNPEGVPIARVTDLLLAAFVDALGPLPEHAALAESVKENGNFLGKKPDARAKWAALPWEPESNVLFLADDEASYTTPEVANATGRILMNVGYPLNYLGPKEKHSGYALFETGQREAGGDVAAELIELCQEREIDSILSPDANTVRAVNLDWPIVARDRDLGEAPTAAHTTEAIWQALKGKRLEIEKPWDAKVYYHAPEALSGDARDAGRKILEAVGCSVVDAPHFESGYGRALDRYDGELQKAIAESCIKAVSETGADVLVTASPGVTALLKGIAKKAKADLEVIDIHEVVAERMKVKEGGVAAAEVPTFEEAEPEEPEIGPDQYRVEFVKEKKVVAVGKTQNILDAAEEAGLDLPSSCRAGSCDTCSARYEGPAPDQSAAEALSDDQKKTYVLTCVGRPKGPMKIWSEEKP